MLIPPAFRGPLRCLSACLLGYSGVAVATDEPVDVATVRLDEVQARIAAFKHVPAADIDDRNNPFRELAIDYLVAYHPLVVAGGRFSIMDEGSWTEPDGPRAAFKRRLERDLRQWHPIFALTFVETVLRPSSWGLYATTLELRGADIEDAIERYAKTRTWELLNRGGAGAMVEQQVKRAMHAEATRLNDVYFEVLEENVIRILAQSLHVDPFSRRLAVIRRVGGILIELDGQTRYHRIDERVREGRGSHTLPETVHIVIGAVLSRPDVDANVKNEIFGDLLGLFILLQNEASRDHLLLLYDRFDAFDELLGEWTPLFDETLNRRTVAFIEISLQTDLEGELGLDVLDRLTQWIVQRLELRADGLHYERLVDTLLLLEHERPKILERYIERFYRDFHAFSPAGYETVIFQLVTIVLRYAEQGVFVKPDPGVGGESTSVPAPGALPPHEKVMTTLRWYDRALAEVGPTLPKIDLDFVEREQQAVLDEILDYLERALDDSRPTSKRARAAFLEVLLQLVKRIAHVADPDEIERRILEPFARTRGFDRDPLLFWRDRKVTNTMDVYLQELAFVVAAARGQ